MNKREQDIASSMEGNWKPAVGDVVELKGGSPDMTITAVFGDLISDPIRVSWFDENDICHFERFPKEALREVVGGDE